MTATSTPDPDRAFLDRLYETFLRQIGEGQPIDLAPLIAARPDLASEIRAIHQNAERIAVARAPSAQPTVSGYELLDVLGEGAMGTVYQAEQQDLRRRVALKVIKRGMDSKAVLARFQHEQQALSVMNHDAIAKVFEAGSTDQGQPYFAMELVEGAPLTHYCDQHKLALDARIELFQSICAGVQHAHQKGVIHRDLKPGNVLVARKGAAHQPKIIDFGVARATDHQLVQQTLFTERGQIIGTPEYMSPEQAAGDALGLDTRTDVYSLGVILYELLTGELPFPSAELRRAGMQEIQRKLREDEPPKPSTAITTQGARATEAAGRRQTTVATLGRELRRDLDWIVLQAMAKEPERRYGSPAELAADLGRYLRHEPVLAGPPTVRYRLWKFVRRYRVQVAAAAAVLVAIVLGGIGTSWFALAWRDEAILQEQQRAEAKRQEGIANRLAQEKGELAAAEAVAKEAAQKSAEAAEQRARELEQVLTFEESQWKEVDTASMGVHLRRAVLAATKEHRRADVEAGLAGVNFTSLALGMLQEQLFDRSLAAIGKGFADQPLVKARLLQSVADTLLSLGLADRATAPQNEAFDIRLRVLGDNDPITLASINHKAALLRAQGKLAEAEPLYREALEKSRVILGEDDPRTLTAINNLGVLLQARGKLVEAEQLYVEALEKSQRLLGGDDPHTLSSITNMGSLLRDQGRLDEAELLLKQALAKQRRILGNDNPDTLISILHLGNLLHARGKLAEAESLYREAMESHLRIHGDDHPDTLTAIGSLGWMLLWQGRRDEADPLCDKAGLRGKQGNLADELSSYSKALDCSRRVLGKDHLITLACTESMGDLLMQMGQYSQAVELLSVAMADARRVFAGRQAHRLAPFLWWLGKAHTQLAQPQDFASAEAELREAHEILSTLRGTTHESTRDCMQSLVDLYEAWHAAEPGHDHNKQAAEWKAQLAPEPKKDVAH